MLKYFPTAALLLAPWRTSPTQRQVLLRLIAVATEHRLELAPLLEAWAREERGGQIHRLRKLALTLREGTPLADALDRFPGLLSDEQVLMIRFATESGSLGPTLRGELQSLTDSAAEPNSNVRLLANYAAFFLILGAPVVLFTQLAVMPEMEKIYYEFSLDLPASMRLARSLLGVTWWTWFLGGVLLLATLWLRCFSWPTAYLRRTLAPRLFASLRSRRIGCLLHRLGESAAAGRPIAGAISTLARHHYDPVLRHRLLFARNELELGGELWPTLHGADLLGHLESEALIAADQTATRAWTLDTLGDARQERSRRRLRNQTGVLLPLVVFTFGAFVFIQAIGIFETLLHLINSLA